VRRGEAFSERERHGGEGQHQAGPLPARQPLAVRDPRHAQGDDEGRQVDEHHHARRAGELQADEDAGELGREQRARQQPAEAAAVPREQRHTARCRPQPDEQPGHDRPQPRLPQRRDLRQRRLRGHLVDAPQQAAKQQDGDGTGVEMGLAHGLYA